MFCYFSLQTVLINAQNVRKSAKLGFAVLWHCSIEFCDIEEATFIISDKHTSKIILCVGGCACVCVKTYLFLHFHLNIFSDNVNCRNRLADIYVVYH